MTLFDPTEHVPLTAARWDEQRVRQGVERTSHELFNGAPGTMLAPPV